MTEGVHIKMKVLPRIRMSHDSLVDESEIDVMFRIVELTKKSGIIACWEDFGLLNHGYEESHGRHQEQTSFSFSVNQLILKDVKYHFLV